MIEFNLLPDVKMQYIKAERLKRLVISVSTLISIAALAIFILLFLFVDFAQKKHLSDINTDIKTNSSKLASNSNLNKILTIQNQIGALPALETQDPAVDRLFNYVTELTPAQATISSLNADFTQNTLSLTGGADSLATVNQFVDALKFTTYKTATVTTDTPAFSTVVLSSFGYSQAGSSVKPANYTITLAFDPVIFGNASPVTLTVPKITTTRSITGQPTDLFQSSGNTSPGGTH